MEKDEIIKLIKEEKDKDIATINQRIDQILLNFVSDIKKEEPKEEPKEELKKETPKPFIF